MKKHSLKSFVCGFLCAILVTAFAVPALAANPSGALGNIAYFGDRSKCRLEPKTAVAYAEVLDRPEEQNTEVFLADFAGDGYPLLVVLGYADSDSSAVHSYKSYSIYGYFDGRVQSVSETCKDYNGPLVKTTN